MNLFFTGLHKIVQSSALFIVFYFLLLFKKKFLFNANQYLPYNTHRNNPLYISTSKSSILFAFPGTYKIPLFNYFYFGHPVDQLTG